MLEKAELENEVWRCAARAYREGLTEFIGAGLKTYARPPGYDDMTRLYQNSVGVPAFQALRECLKHDRGNGDPHATFLWIRQRKRNYLYYCIVQRLVTDHLATGEMRDSLFGIDLGL